MGEAPPTLNYQDKFMEKASAAKMLRVPTILLQILGGILVYAGTPILLLLAIMVLVATKSARVATIDCLVMLGLEAAFIVVLSGAIAMSKLKCYTLAVAGVFLVLLGSIWLSYMTLIVERYLDLISWGVFGLGIYALVQLARPEVRRAFS